MKNKLKPILITVIAIFIVYMAGKYILDTLFGDMCGNDIVQKRPSPGGKKVAYMFTRDCGATTGFSPQLSILDKDDKFPNKSGNAFRSDKNFSIGWIDDETLQVTFDKKSETYEMDKRVNGVKVKYVEK